MRKKCLLANWKMLGDTQQISTLVEQLIVGISSGAPNSEVVLFPPAPYLRLVAEAIKATSIALGAQTVAEFAPGAYTGEVAAEMLIDVGCRYVLVGHSERRTLFAENDAKISGKFSRAMKLGLIPVLCIGETLKEWQAEETFAVLTRQLTAVFAEANDLKDFIIAYEPVWAIGTGKVASPEHVQSVHRFIRAILTDVFHLEAQKIPIVYGGSVKAQNFAALLAMEDIDGGLIGGASWQAAEFIEMSKMCLI